MITCNHLLLGEGKINNLKKVGKAFLSQLLCISTIIGTASCNDDQVFNQADNTPLQVSVNAQGTQSSRAIIHGEYLPDGSSIGISLFNASDGEDYDNQGYFNVKYTASGEGESQSWAAQGITPSISANPANLLAYYPWSDDADLDLTAIPVENASQTDYMYAGIIEGITNANPKVNIIMKHALTAIRVNLVLGNYTGDAAVSGIAVKSPALGSAATLSVYDGMLDNISGQGDEFALTTEFDLSAVGTTTDVLFVPDTSVTEGSTTVSATIGGKKYTAAISFDEAYLQGYIYTYTLTLNNSGFEVTKVNVTPWQTGNNDSATLEPYIEDDSYVAVAYVYDTGEGYNYSHNLYNFVGTVDWGDGTSTVYDEPVTGGAHTYPNEGSYTITAKGKAEGLRSAECTGDFESGEFEMINISSYQITDVIHIGKDMGMTNMSAAFAGHPITSLPDGIFDGLTEVTNFDKAFAMSQLKTIPEGLFDNCKKVVDYNFTFGMTPIQSIPEGLFAGQSAAKNMFGLFAMCQNLQTIPANLFKGCTGIEYLGFLFMSSGVSEVPVGLFDDCVNAIDMGAMFSNCYNLETIPAGLFDNNTKVTSFGSLFESCWALYEIPQGLFDNTPEVWNFEKTFYETWITEIPNGLFDNCTKVTNFAGVFYNTPISAIPSGLFDNCTAVTSFNETFSRCYALTTIPEGLFDDCTEVTDFSDAFYYCVSLTEIPEGLFDYNKEVTRFYKTFSGCGSLTSIPEGLFDYNTKVEDFRFTFSGCPEVTEIPVGLFENNTKVTSFNGTFQWCYGLQTIPEGLFNSCTEVTDFDGTFAECVNIISVPINLFDNCKKVSRFDGYYEYSRGCFENCNKLAGESPYTVINIDGVDTKVHLYERSNYPKYFTVPIYYSKCFKGCTGLTDYSSIPSNWK